MESLLAEAALPLSYAGNWSRRLDSNQQHAITHGLRPIKEIEWATDIVDVCPAFLPYTNAACATWRTRTAMTGSDDPLTSAHSKKRRIRIELGVYVLYR